MPDIHGLEYILSHWQEIGRCSSGAMGPIPLSATEIQAWQEGTHNDLMPWEFTAMLEMSRGYVSMLLEGQKPESSPPFGDPVREFDRDLVSKKVSNAFKAFLQARKK